MDTVYWFGGGDTDLPTVRWIVGHIRSIQAADPACPVILAADGRVMDGMHRIARAMLDNRATIAAVRFTTDPDPDYRNCAPEDLPYPKDS